MPNGDLNHCHIVNVHKQATALVKLSGGLPGNIDRGDLGLSIVQKKRSLSMPAHTSDKNLEPANVVEAGKPTVDVPTFPNSEFLNHESFS